MSDDPAPPPSSPAPASTPCRSSGLIASFGHAFCGLGYFFRTQRNGWIHAVCAVAALALAAWLGISRTEWAALVLAIAGVIALEGMNTALETVVDLASPQIHPLAKIAKDVSAGMVLLAAIAAVAIGLIILGPPLWGRVIGS